MPSSIHKTTAASWRLRDNQAKFWHNSGIKKKTTEDFRVSLWRASLNILGVGGGTTGSLINVCSTADVDIVVESVVYFGLDFLVFSTWGKQLKTAPAVRVYTEINQVGTFTLGCLFEYVKYRNWRILETVNL